MVALEEKLKEVSERHPQGTMNVCNTEIKLGVICVEGYLQFHMQQSLKAPQLYSVSEETQQPVTCTAMFQIVVRQNVFTV